MNEFIPFLQRPDAPLNGAQAAAQDPYQRSVAQQGISPSPQPLAQQGGSMQAVAPQSATPPGVSGQLRHLEPPRYPARIAVYDDMIAPPRVVVIDPCDITDYLTQITQTVYQLMAEQGGDLPHMIIRELVENFIHASFIEPTISILDKGQTLVFSDQGPGIANKAAAVRPSFSTATSEMKYYIRGVGSGLPMVEDYLKMRHGSMKIEDNLDHGTIVTVSFAHKEEPAAAQPAYQPQPAQTQTATQPPAGYGYPQGMPAQGAYAQGSYGYAQMPQGAWGTPAGQVQQPGWGWPQGQPGWQQPAWPYGQQPQGMPYGQMQQAYPAAGQQAAPQPYPGQALPYPGSQGAQPSAPQNVQAMGAAPATPTLDPKLAPVLRAFALEAHVGGKELAEALGMSAPTASRRLRELADAGLATKVGQKYELTPQGAHELTLLTSEGE